MSEIDNDDESFAADKLIEAIENQLEAGEPAAAQATLNKLTLVGYERADSLEMMAMVLANEVNRMFAEDRPFDSARYEQLLRALPQLPEDDESN